MATVIRLQRAGTKKRPYYRLVAADKRSPRDGKFIEKLGTFNPLLAKSDEKRLSLKGERIEYWLGLGAQPSEKVTLLISKAGIGKNSTTVKKVISRRDKSITDRQAAIEAKKKAEAAAKAAEEAKLAAEEAAKAAAEAPQAA